MQANAHSAPFCRSSRGREGAVPAEHAGELQRSILAALQLFGRLLLFDTFLELRGCVCRHLCSVALLPSRGKLSACARLQGQPPTLSRPLCSILLQSDVC